VSVTIAIGRHCKRCLVMAGFTWPECKQETHKMKHNL